MKKKVISLLLTTVLVFTMLAGCGSDDSSEENADSTSSDDAETETVQDDESDGEVTTLTWALWDKDTTTYYQPLIDAFEAENPDVKVEMLDLGSTDFMTVLGTQLSGGDDTIDIIFVKDIPGYSTLVGKNQLEPLSSWVESEGIDLDEYQGIAEQLEIDGELYALPCRNDFWVTFYNKDLFDAAGMDYPQSGMTLDEFDEVAREVSEKATEALGTHVYGSHYHTWRSMVQCTALLTGENTLVDGDYEFLEPYYELVLAQQEDEICQDYAALKSSSLHYSAAFYQDNVAMMSMGTWFIPTLAEAIANGESEAQNWGIIATPVPEGAQDGASVATLTSMGISSASQNKEEAQRFIKFVCGSEGAAIFAETGTMPAIQTDEVVDLISGIEGFPEDDASKEALYPGPTYLEMAVNDFASELEVILNDSHDDIMTNNIGIAEGLKEVSEQAQTILGE